MGRPGAQVLQCLELFPLVLVIKLLFNLLIKHSQVSTCSKLL